MGNVYVCTGECGGVAAVQKNCGAESCSHFDKPLKETHQCSVCEEQSAEDGAPHACMNCK